MTSLPIAIVIGFLLMALAWLMPNHYWPWVSFHSELCAAVGFALVCATCLMKGKTRVGWPPIALVVVAAAVIPLVQGFTGLIFFMGDAWMVSLYLVGLALAVVAGHTLSKGPAPDDVLDLFWLCVLIGALLSAGIALGQWTEVRLGWSLMVEMPPLSRPFGNMAQPNHLATLLVLGVVGAFALWGSGRLGRFSFFLCTGFLLFGLTLTGSRAGWAEMGVLVAWIMWSQRRLGSDPRRMAAPALGALYAALVGTFPLLAHALILDTGRSAQKLGQLGVRQVHWESMAEAILHRPWLGYGWNQVSVAQAQVALNHPATGNSIEHSHNILLDLLVWNGIPLGMLLILAVAWWFVTRARRCASMPVALLLAGVAMMWVHAMLEFPIEYAYFLLPMGFMMGAVDARLGFTAVQVHRPVTWAFAGLAAVGMAWVTVEYVELEEAGRKLRMDKAGFGHEVASEYVPKVHLLTQLHAFYSFAEVPVKKGMLASDIQHMQDTAFRFTFSPLLMRYALAAGLNGQPDAASKALGLLCKTNLPRQCVNARNAWAELADGQHAELKAVVMPQVPVID